MRTKAIDEFVMVRHAISPCDILPSGLPGLVLINGAEYRAFLPSVGEPKILGYLLTNPAGENLRHNGRSQNLQLSRVASLGSKSRPRCLQACKKFDAVQSRRSNCLSGLVARSFHFLKGTPE